MAIKISRISRKMENALATCSAAFMNDTKWREVLTIVSLHELPIQFAYIYEKKFGFSCLVPRNGLGKTYTKDWGSGPAEYKEIFAVRWDRFENVRDPITGRISKDECRSKALMAELSKLGQLPIEVENDFIVIRGYKAGP